LATLAGITCLMRASVGNIMDAPGGKSLTLALLAECGQIAAAYGFANPGEASQRMRGVLTERGSPFTASMLRDIESGARIEADHVLGDLLERASAKVLEAPLLKISYCHLKAYERRRESRLAQPA
jgi:2-dehydropantoate 2-reductase